MRMRRQGGIGLIQIAVYGKGGIGKSTVSANISYALAGMGKRVLQIGCDPKHDSTRALLDGKAQTTVLSYIRDTPPYERRLEDVVLEGVRGIRCVEAGGPEPGIGCAGRGILSTFDTLKRLGLDDMGFDVKLYDVLGDVVCGGFAVPLRNEYADGVYLVTSGEFMSIYAANNILKGLRNFDKGVPRVAGIILNCRGMEGEYESVGRFADAVGLPIVACIPRSRLFSDAEAAGRTVADMFPDSEVTRELRRVSDHVMGIMEGRTELLRSQPLNDDGMALIAGGRNVPGTDAFREEARTSGCRSCAESPKKITTEDRIIPSCAAAGAVHGCSSITDSVTIVHGPRSCAHIMTSSKNLTEIGRRRTIGAGRIPQGMRIASTDMDDTVSVFGGAGLLEQKIRDLISEGHRSFFVVTTCVSGIIGDNTIDIVNAISNEHPDLYFRVVEADGNILGDWEEGYIESANALLDMVDETIGPEDDAVNLVAERYFFKRGERLDNEVFDLFSSFGLRVNCRFMYESTMDSVVGFKRGRMNFVSNSDRASRGVSGLIESKLGVRVEREPLPVGVREYAAFSERIGREFGMEGRAAEVCEREVSAYRSETEALRERLEGRTVLVENRFSQNTDWLLELLLDLGTEIVAVDSGPVHRWRERRPASRYASSGIRFRQNCCREDVLADMDRHSPDIVLTDSVISCADGVRNTTYSRPAPGLRGVLGYARRFADLTLLPATEGWRNIS